MHLIYLTTIYQHSAIKLFLILYYKNEEMWEIDIVYVKIKRFVSAPMA